MENIVQIFPIDFVFKNQFSILFSLSPLLSSPFSSHLSNKLYQDLRYGKLPRVLRINDRLSMANGIELRVPFLDHKLFKYCFNLKNDMKINDAWQAVLRIIMRNE